MTSPGHHCSTKSHSNETDITTEVSRILHETPFGVISRHYVATWNLIHLGLFIFVLTGCITCRLRYTRAPAEYKCSLFCKECAIIILGFVEVRLNITVNYRHKHTQLSWDATSKHLGSTVRHFMLWNPAFKNSRQPDGHFYGLFL